MLNRVNIDWKLYRTLVVAGLTLIVAHQILSNWGDFKAGLSGGLREGHAAGKP
jgi:hypothetical protein